MAGHSKWANIRHRKSRQDAKKGKIFAKIIRQITVAAQSNNNEKDNPKLRAAIDKALLANMARDVINRAIDKSSKDATNLEETVYEGYVAGGVAFLVEVLTDNKNRAASEIRHAFSKCGGLLSSNGSVAYLFQRVGRLVIAQHDEDTLLEIATAVGAKDMEQTVAGDFLITTLPDMLYAVQDALTANGFSVLESSVDMLADTYIDIKYAVHAEKIMQLHEMLDTLEDVQNIYNNAAIDDALFIAE